jgi:hypothetical protein
MRRGGFILLFKEFIRQRAFFATKPGGISPTHQAFLDRLRSTHGRTDSVQRRATKSLNREITKFGYLRSFARP